MFTPVPRGPAARRYTSDPAAPRDPVEARLHAWALAAGAIRTAEGGAYSIRRPHRATLPDLDFTLVAPAPRRPGLLARWVRGLLRRFRRGGQTPGKTRVSTPGTATAEPSDLPAEAPGPHGRGPAFNHARAA